MTWVAAKPLVVNGAPRSKGALVPEAGAWPAIARRAAINNGRIAWRPDALSELVADVSAARLHEFCSRHGLSVDVKSDREGANEAVMRFLLNGLK
jgi:hypothetical protein